MKLSDFDYYLPKELIAQSPIEPRDASRLMVVREHIEHRRFYEIVNYLEKGDTLVLNDSRVIPAKLRGRKITGGRVEALVISRNGNEYECIIKGKNIREGLKLYFGEFEAKVVEIKEEDIKKYVLRFNETNVLEKIGETPLPPYIKKKLNDDERYQTVYSTKKGSIAAPTAGLHFTKELLEIIRRKVNIAYVTLHIGAGTFLPVRGENHSMVEYFSISNENARIINENKGKLIACGTTTVKALESSCVDGKIVPKEGYSNLFIHPPYRFKSDIHAMITNFHLPRSTLLMLVCAFAGKDRVMNAYREAIANSYRFYSFGDAMLIFRNV